MSTGTLAPAVGLTRQAVRNHLVALAEQGLVRLTGQGRGARWERTALHRFRWTREPGLEEDRMWARIRDDVPELGSATTGARQALAYGMTEMLNNAIEHSHGSVVRVTVGREGGDLMFTVEDDGVGVFASVRRHFGFESDEDALLQLSKGRQTTMPAAHSGQGIFFTSKIVDRFALHGQGLSWLVDNRRQDQAIAPGTGRPGTTVVLVLDPSRARRPKEVFDRFTDVDAPALPRTQVTVRLAGQGDDFLSRSEARRIAHQLQDFDEVVLDFASVPSVGQGFVDEIFRVWAWQHPTTRLVPINMGPEVAFMVGRGLPRMPDQPAGPAPRPAAP